MAYICLLAIFASKPGSHDLTAFDKTAVPPADGAPALPAAATTILPCQRF